jgi:16S rRNA (guanine966-N2)-methyltransferase
LTRPTSDRVREAVFSILASLDAVEDARVLDAFAGSGALGIEALSRGAAAATFVEADGDALACIRANLAVLGPEAERATVIRGDALRVLAGPAGWDLILADPPYRWDGWDTFLDLAGTRTRLLVAETGGPWEPGPLWETVRVRAYGGTVVTVAQPLEPRALQEGEH